MIPPFNRWTDRIIAAEDESSRQSLVSEIIRWRAGCLTEVTNQRDAAHALARLYMLLGLQPQAVQEGQTLMSLCQIPPNVSREEWTVASAFLQTLGGTPPRRANAPSRPQKAKAPKEKRSREAKAPSKGHDQFSSWVKQVVDGKSDDVRNAIKGKKGPQIQIFRIWMTLNKWAAQEPGEKRDQSIAHLERRLRQQLAPQLQTKKPARPEPVSDVDKALAAIIGSPIPRRRDSRVRLLEGFVKSHPEKSDAVAAAALTHHVAVSGVEAPAPWFVSLVGLAMLHSDGAETKAVIETLQAQKAVCVEPFSEEAYVWSLALIRLALSEGWTLNAWRRGILPRIEPVHRKIWTLRIEKDGFERMMAIAPSQTEAYAEGLPKQLSDRLNQLSRTVLLAAPGEGNEGLRSAANEASLPLLEEMDWSAALKQLAALSPKEAVVQRKGPSPQSQALDELATLLRQEEPPSLEVLTQKLGELRRARDVFRCVSDLTQNEGLSLSADRAALILTAMHAVVPQGSRVLEGTTLAVQHLCREPNAALLACLTTGDESVRYGGVGIEGVLQIAQGLVSAGWSLNRVLRGTTRRERRDNEVLESIGAGADEIWRLLIGNEKVTGELVYVASLSAEGRAALPQLLLVERNRQVILPVEPELLEWYRQTDGPAPIGWTGNESEAVAEAIQGWSS
jgi:hypothetical protein